MFCKCCGRNRINLRKILKSYLCFWEEFCLPTTPLPDRIIQQHLAETHSVKTPSLTQNDYFPNIINTETKGFFHQKHLETSTHFKQFRQYCTDLTCIRPINTAKPQTLTPNRMEAISPWIQTRNTPKNSYYVGAANYTPYYNRSASYLQLN